MRFVCLFLIVCAAISIFTNFSLARTDCLSFDMMPFDKNSSSVTSNLIITNNCGKFIKYSKISVIGLWNNSPVDAWKIMINDLPLNKEIVKWVYFKNTKVNGYRLVVEYIDF